MAQGLGKLKSKGAGLKKEKNRNKKSNMKKGARYIAPKKAVRVQEEKLKKLHRDEALNQRLKDNSHALHTGVEEKGLEKAIKHDIESEICTKVKSIESKSFHVLQTPADIRKKEAEIAAEKKK